MNWVSSYFIENFILICICLIMYVIAIQRFRQHPRISLYTICIISTALLLSIFVHVQLYAKATSNILLAVICSIFGYSLRPVCIYFLILMNERIIPKKFLWVTFVPLILNFIVYLCALIPHTQTIIFGFASNSDGSISFMGGPLRFTSHVISILYLLFLLYICFATLKARHLTHGISLLICLVFVVTAVVIETFFNDNGDIIILNTTIAVSTMIYYLFLYMERTQVDTLTGLFNRETYYHDILKMNESATGVIQFDMNGLKYINDNYGHLEGDKALATIANVIVKSVNRNMYAYRLGGDEYIVIANNCPEDEIKKTIDKFKYLLSATAYRCSIGYAYRSDKNQSFTDLLKEAEKKMYEDKAEFYKTAKIERRKAEQ